MKPFAEPPAGRGDGLMHVAIRLGLLVLLLYWSFTLIRPFIPILAWSIVLTAALYPVYDWMAERLGNRRKLSSAVVTLLTFAIIAVPITWLGVGLARGMKFAASHLEAGHSLIPTPPDVIRVVCNWPAFRAPARWPS